MAKTRLSEIAQHNKLRTAINEETPYQRATRFEAGKVADYLYEEVINAILDQLKPHTYNGWRFDYDKMSGVMGWVKGDWVISCTPGWDGFDGVPFVLDNHSNGYGDIDRAEFKVKQSDLRGDPLEDAKMVVKEMKRMIDEFSKEHDIV